VKIQSLFIAFSITLIVFLGLTVYSNSLTGEFILDDTYLIEHNPFIQDRSHLTEIFRTDITGGTALQSSFYRPLQALVLMINYSLWELDVRGYHITNVLFHILTALALFWLLRLLFNDGLISLYAAVLFIVCPLHTEAVSYISGGADSLMSMFLLLSFVFYIRHSERRGAVNYIMLVATFILALLARESALILPLLLLLYHWLRGRESDKKYFSSPAFISIAAIALLYIILRLTLLRDLLSHGLYSSTVLQRLPGFFVAIAEYMRLLIAPVNLHMEYGNHLFAITHPKAITGIVILSGLLWYVLRKRDSDRIIVFSIAWFLITLLPQSNLYPINAYMAEHWLYLPSVGFFLVVAKYLAYLYRRRASKTFAMAVILVAAGVYGYLTIRQNSYWRDPFTFYNRTLRFAPNNAKMLNNLAHLYYKRGEKKEAIRLFEKAIEANPAFAEAYNNLGIIYYYDFKDAEKAIGLFKKTVDIQPDFAGAYNNLGSAYRNIGKIEQALEAYKKAIEIKPDYAAAHNNISMAYFQARQYELAVYHCDKAKSLGYAVHPRFLRMLEKYRK